MNWRGIQMAWIARHERARMAGNPVQIAHAEAKLADCRHAVDRLVGLISDPLAERDCGH